MWVKEFVLSSTLSSPIKFRKLALFVLPLMFLLKIGFIYAWIVWIQHTSNSRESRLKLQVV